MPFPKKTYRKKRRPFKRNRKRKYYRRGTTVSTINKRSFGPIANRMLTKMRFVEHTTLNPAIGTIANHTYRANGLFDPNYTGVGHQPYGFDQLVGVSTGTGFYQKYRVLGAKITAMFMTYGTSIGDNYVVGIQGTDESTIFSPSTFDIIESGKSRWNYLTNSASTKSSCKVTSTFGGAKFFGPLYKTDTIFQGSFSTDPARQFYFHVFAAPVNPADDPNPINVVVTIDYIVELTQPQQFISS